MRPWCLVAVLALAATSACGGDAGSGPDDDDGDTRQDSLRISFPADTVRLPIGGTATLAVTVTRVGTVSGNIVLSIPDCPLNVQCTYDPASLGPGQSTSTLTLTAAENAPSQVRLGTVAATAGTVFAFKTFPLVVFVPPGFSLTAVPALDVVKGQPGQVTVAIARLGGFAGAVSLSLEGGTGVSGSFNPNPATGNQSVLTLTAAESAPTGSQTLTVRGTAEGLAARTVTFTANVLEPNAPAYTLTVTPTTLSADAGTTATATAKVSRTGGFTGWVTLSVEGLIGPIGWNAPAVQPGDSVVTISLNIALTAPAGTQALQVVGKATGMADRRVPVELTVRAVSGFLLGISPASVTTAPGAAPQNVGVNITRAGGFSGEVALTVTGLPAGVTGTFNPASTTGNTAVLAIAAAAGAVPGGYTAVVRANAPGLPERTANLAITVAAGGTPITWRFCAPVPAPVLFAFADGTSQPVVVQASGDGTYATSVTAGKGIVVLVVPGLPVVDVTDEATTPVQPGRLRWWPARGGTGTSIYHFEATTAELQALAALHCPPAVARKSVNASVADVAGQAFAVSLGDTAFVGMPGAATSFELAGVPAGVHDLFAARAAPVAPSVIPTRLIVRRDLDPPAGSTIPVLDFGAAEAVRPDSAEIVLSGLEGSARAEVVLWAATANGTRGRFASLDSLANGTHRYYGLPAAQLRAGDLHSISAWTRSQFPERRALATRYTRQVVARDLAFPLDPPPAGMSTISTLPLVRLEAHLQLGQFGSPLTGETLELVVYQEATQRAIVMYQTRGWRGTSSTNLGLRTPDLRLLPGWNEATWGIQSTASVTWGLETRSAGLGFVPADGSAFYFRRWQDLHTF